MKKLIFHLFMSIFLIVSVSACGSSSDLENKVVKENKKKEEASNEAKPEKLIIWEEKGKAEALKPMIEAFEKEYGIKVEPEELEIASEMYERLRRDGPIGNGKAPDVVTFSHEKVGQIVKEGLIQEVKVNDEVLNAFIEPSIRGEIYQDKVFGLPKSVTTSVFIYNKKLMAKAPETMNDLYKMAGKLRKGNVNGYYANWNDFHDSYGVMAGMGGYIFKDKNGKLDPSDIGLNNKGAIKGAAYIQKWYRAGLIPKGDKASIEKLFIQGSLASFMSDGTSFTERKDTGTAPMPKLPNGQPMKTLMKIKGWHVTAFTKHPYWSTKLVEHLTNDDNAMKRYEITGEIPPNKSIKHNAAINENERAQALSIQLQYAEPVPNIPEMNKVWGPMNSAMDEITIQKAKPKRALDKAVKTIKKER
ncbi:extracellular solute-binding protein [Peribacillus sp. V2I11]|uniref:extracellular solute-binding protein n=1 Tax=Peribacillus sp. V2I11 TaxID=3042277 RepID=UPI00278AD0F3|nr:extracellular solute-binding protein [Peribacillus sp. V2I11]MDQ0880029.1 arabinogalactan oligomer/maltooligosaccharide transport system substrate-binding protein [Peribacillus sp. V2I11]